MPAAGPATLAPGPLADTCGYLPGLVMLRPPLTGWSLQGTQSGSDHRLTKTLIALDIVVVPAVLAAWAVNVWGPVDTFLVFQLNW